VNHGLMYQGAFETNFPALRPGAEDYLATDGSRVPLPAWPDEVDGVRIGYMERAGKRFLVVRLQFEEHDVVLQTPVVLDALRHLGTRRLAGRPVLIGDDLASALLDDIIETNPEQSTDIALLINRVNQVRRGPNQAFG
jgi:hypothetical protein